MNAEEILIKAAGHLADRAKTYDKPEGERSMEKTVQMFNTLSGTQLTTEQGWLFMVILKMVRSQLGDFKSDNYEDGAAYFALAGERTSTPKEQEECCEPYPRPRQTRRQQLISAGIPAHDFDGINDPDLDEPADYSPSLSPQPMPDPFSVTARWRRMDDSEIPFSGIDMTPHDFTTAQAQPQVNQQLLD